MPTESTLKLRTPEVIAFIRDLIIADPAGSTNVSIAAAVKQHIGTFVTKGQIAGVINRWIRLPDGVVRGNTGGRPQMQRRLEPVNEKKLHGAAQLALAQARSEAAREPEPAPPVEPPAIVETPPAVTEAPPAAVEDIIDAPWLQWLPSTPPKPLRSTRLCEWPGSSNEPIAFTCDVRKHTGRPYCEPHCGGAYQHFDRNRFAEQAR